MAGDRKEPGLGKSNPDKDADKTNPQDDFLDLIPERLAPRSRAADPVDDEPPLSAEPAGAPQDGPRAEDLRGPYAEDDHDDEIHDDEDEGRSGGSKGVMAAVVIGAVAAGIAGWYLFLREEPQQVADTTPVIAADDQPYKVKPADPGGMDVPDTDKMVYDRLGQNSDGGEVENLLSEPERPTAPPAAAQAPAPADAGGSLAPLPEADVAATPEPEAIDEAPAETAAAEPEPAQPTQQAEAPAPAQPTPTTKPAAPAPQPTQQAAAEPPPAEPQQQAATPTPVAPRAAAPASSGGGSEMVQLAALRDQAGAEAAWKKIQGANSDLLGNLSLDVQRADLGEKGIYFRVRAKGLASADEAKALCEKLKDRGQGCLVVR